MRKFFYSIYEFFFERWKIEIIEEGEKKFKRLKTRNEQMTSSYLKFTSWNTIFNPSTEEDNYIHYTKTYVKYKYTNKFDGSVKIEIKYFN